MKKSILVANHHLQDLGGSEVFTYTLIAELIRIGHEVYYFTFFKGVVSDKIELLGACFYDFSSADAKRKCFDLALISHQTIFRLPIKAKLVVQTCHGLNHPFEQPSVYADRIVAVSERVSKSLRKKGYNSILIRNGIDCNRFRMERPINKVLKSVLSLCQNDAVNKMIKEVCDKLQLQYTAFSKTSTAIWDVQKAMNEVDLVFSLGRGACEAMACGRNVFVYDHRVGYQPYGEGLIIPEEASLLVQHNFSGSYFKKTFTMEQIMEELQKYNAEWGIRHRDFALNHLNIREQVQTYLAIEPLSNKEKRAKYKKMILQYLSNLRFNGNIVKFEEYEEYYLIVNSKKKQVVNDKIIQRLKEGKKTVIHMHQNDLHKFELIHH